MQNTAKGYVTLISVSEAIVYKLLPSATLIKVDTSGDIYVGKNLTCTATKTIGDLSPVTCTSDEVTIYYTVTTKGVQSLKYLYTHYPDPTELVADGNYDAYDFYLYVGKDVTNPDENIYIDHCTISIVTDGQIDTYFKVWQGDLEDPNNPLDKPWLDSDSSHTGDYYIATNGYYWKFNGTVWVKLTDPLLTNIYNAIDRSGNTGYYIDCITKLKSAIENYETEMATQYEDAVESQKLTYFDNNSILYELGDLMEIKKYKTYEEDGVFYFEKDSNGDKIEYTEMYMCCEQSRTEEIPYKKDDWILSTNLEGRQKDAGLEIYKNDIVLTADRLKLQDVAGHLSASMNLFVQDENTHKEANGLYINTDLLKINGDVDVDGDFAEEKDLTIGNGSCFFKGDNNSEKEINGITYSNGSAGSGHVANGNIKWDKDGNASVTGSIYVNNIKFGTMTSYNYTKSNNVISYTLTSDDLLKANIFFPITNLNSIYKSEISNGTYTNNDLLTVILLPDICNYTYDSESGTYTKETYILDGFLIQVWLVPGSLKSGQNERLLCPTGARILNPSLDEITLINNILMWNASGGASVLCIGAQKGFERLHNTDKYEDVGFIITLTSDSNNWIITSISGTGYMYLTNEGNYDDSLPESSYHALRSGALMS